MALIPEDPDGAFSDEPASVPPPGWGADAPAAVTSPPSADAEPSSPPSWYANPEAPDQQGWDGNPWTEQNSEETPTSSEGGQQPVLRSKLLMSNTRGGLENVLTNHLRPYRKEQVVSLSYAQTQHFVLLSRFSVVVVTEEPPAG